MGHYLFKIIYIFARNWLNKKTLNMMSQKRLSLRLLYRDATKTISHTKNGAYVFKKIYLWHAIIKRGTDMPTYCSSAYSFHERKRRGYRYRCRSVANGGKAC